MQTRMVMLLGHVTKESRQSLGPGTIFFPTEDLRKNMNQNTKKSDREMLQWSSTPAGVGSKSRLDATVLKEMYGDFSDFKKSYDFLMKLELNVPYLLVVVSCQVSCVDLKSLRPYQG